MTKDQAYWMKLNNRFNRKAKKMRESVDSSMPDGYNAHEWRASRLNLARVLESKATKAAESMRTAPESKWEKKDDGGFKFVSSFEEQQDRKETITLVEETEELLEVVEKGLKKTMKKIERYNEQGKDTRKLVLMIDQMNETHQEFTTLLGELDKLL